MLVAALRYMMANYSINMRRREIWWDAHPGLWPTYAFQTQTQHLLSNYFEGDTVNDMDKQLPVSM